MIVESAFAKPAYVVNELIRRSTNTSGLVTVIFFALIFSQLKNEGGNKGGDCLALQVGTNIQSWITVILLAIKAIENEVGLGPGDGYADGPARPHFQVAKQAHVSLPRSPQAREQVPAIDYCCIDRLGVPRHYLSNPPGYNQGNYPQNWECYEKQKAYPKIPWPLRNRTTFLSDMKEHFIENICCRYNGRNALDLLYPTEKGPLPAVDEDLVFQELRRVFARSAFAVLGVLGRAGIGLNVGLGGGIGFRNPRFAPVPTVGCPNGGNCGRRRGNYHADYGMSRSDGVGMGADERRNLGMSGNHANYGGGVVRNNHGVDMRPNSGMPGNYAGSYGGGMSPNNHGGDVRDSPRMQRFPADRGPRSSGGPNKYRHNYTIKHNYAIEGNETLVGGNEIDFHKDGEIETSHTTKDSNLNGHSNLAAISQHGGGVPRCPNAGECAGASGAARSVGANAFDTMPAAVGEGAAPGSLGPSGLHSLQGGVGAEEEEPMSNNRLSASPKSGHRVIGNMLRQHSPGIMDRYKRRSSPKQSNSEREHNEMLT
uniref:Uncharacterized protein n=1 Tax=Glossina pallidipes TaxID=7398 RepID=A0A1A9ZAK4_GLOPL